MAALIEPSATVRGLNAMSAGCCTFRGAEASSLGNLVAKVRSAAYAADAAAPECMASRTSLRNTVLRMGCSLLEIARAALVLK